MNDGCEHYEQVCRDEFAAIHGKLDRLDDAIRGNGKTGILVRLDRLEAARRLRSRLIWIIVGAAVTLVVTGLWRLVAGT